MNISRRRFLKAAGVTIALPFLPSMPSFGQSKWAIPQSTKRMVFVDSGLGMYPGHFFPKDYGLNFTPSLCLKSMMKHTGKFTVFSRMDHPNIYSGHGGLKQFRNGGEAPNGSRTTVDQIAANAVGYDTRYPSIHMVLGGSAPHSITVSGVKKRTMSSAEALFKELFVDDTEKAKKQIAKDIEEKGSVLDLITDQAKSVDKNLNQVDRDKLDEYLTAIREAEVQLQGQKRWQSISKPTLKKEQISEDFAKGDQDFEGASSTVFDLFHLAIQSNASRVFTLSYGMHNRKINLDGVSSGYHSLSHHGHKPDKVQQLGIIESFYIEQVSRFVEKLDGSTGETGNLLDDTMVFFGSPLSDAGRHSNRDLPIMIAGGGFRHKGHFNAENGFNKEQMPLNNLYTSMLQNFGLEIEKYGSATGNVNDILS